MDILALIARAESLNIKETMGEAMEDTSKDMVAAQKDQMLHGLKSTGKKIGKYRNPYYANKKYSMNTLAGKGNVDLKLKGTFQGETKVDIRGTSVVFYSTDNLPTEDGMGKADKLVSKYGDDIWGLSKPYAAEYSNESLGPEIIRRVKKQFYGL